MYIQLYTVLLFYKIYCMNNYIYRFDGCHWEAKDIVVPEIEVRIIPPYSPDSIKGDAKAIDHIKKIVSIFLFLVVVKKKLGCTISMHCNYCSG